MPCPICGDGTVGFDGAKTHLDRESSDLDRLVRQGFEPPGELSGTFTGSLTCDNVPCKSVLAVAGDYVYSYDDVDDFGNVDLVDLYKARFIHPPLLLIASPPKTPPSVTSEIEGASSLLYLNPSAAGSRLRYALEALLDAKKIRKLQVGTGNGRKRLSLHGRIEAFAQTNREIANVILAVKWIGNEATHGPDLTISEVLIAAEALDAALRALYDDSDAKLKAMVARINRNRGLGRR